MNYREAGSGGVQTRRSPRRQIYCRSERREKIVVHGRQGGDLVMAEAIIEGGECPVGDFLEPLRLLARWLARETLKEG